MSVNIYSPLSYKFMQFVFNNGKVFNRNNIKKRAFLQDSQSQSLKYTSFLMSTAVAFLWPVKKISKEGGDASTAKKQPSVLELSDNLFENAHYEECLKLLLNSEDKDNIEIQWRICRVLYNKAKEMKYDKTQKNELILEAYNIISKQVEGNQDHYAVHKWYALLLDAKSSLDGIKERIQQLENVKKHMDLAVTLNPNDATTLHMLGEWCFQITEMPWHQRKIVEVLFASPPQSSYEDALEYFLRAESVQPRFYSINLLRLGYCYLKLQKEDQAKYYLKLAASYPVKSNDDLRANKEATELLKKLKSD